MRTRGLSRLLPVSLAAITLLLSPAVRADAVLPPPEDCPPGSIGQSSHNGPFCSVTTCSTDADCEGKCSWRDRDRGRRLRCEDSVPLCIEQREFSNWRRPQNSQTKNIVPVAVGSCDGSRACASPAVCETTKRCVFQDRPATPPTRTSGPASAPAGASSKDTSGGACSCVIVGGVAPAAPLSVALLGIGLLWARVARRRRPCHTRSYRLLSRNERNR